MLGDIDVYPLRTHAPSLQYLKETHAIWSRQHDLYGDNYNKAIVRLVLIGWMETSPYDLTSLGSAIRLSRQQTSRRCTELVDMGWIEINRVGKQSVVTPTIKLIEEAEKDIKVAAPRLVSRLRGWIEERSSQQAPVAVPLPMLQGLTINGPQVAAQVARQARLTWWLSCVLPWIGQWL